MNNYNCEIVADSLNTFGNRITTFKLTYPRIVHAELMTHRVFSRNAASSRAVPVKKMIESVKNNMFTPLAIQKEHKGMQGSEYFEGEQLKQAIQLWCDSAESALEHSEKMRAFGITKQLTNRVLEPYQYYQVLVTATEWENFFKLRCPQYEIKPNREGKSIYRSKKDAMKNHIGTKNYTKMDWLNVNLSQAEIHIQAIAELMWDAYNESIPKELKAGEWHIPFGDNFNDDLFKSLVINNSLINNQHNKAKELMIKIAIARCARISYQTLGDNPKIDYEADIKLHDMLLISGHFSPFEHVAKCMSNEEYNSYFQGRTFVNKNESDYKKQNEYWVKNGNGWCRNFRGFIQYRSLIDKV